MRHPRAVAMTEGPLKKKQPESSAPLESPAAYEQLYVHDVYNAIAPHFSSTRFKAWPRIRAFLEELPQFSLVADVGCGNGKYFASAQRFAAPSASPAENEKVNAHKDAQETVLGHRYLLGMDINLPLLKATQRTVADPNFDASMVGPSAAAVTPSSSPAPRKGKRARGGSSHEAVDEETQRRSEGMPRTDVLQCDARFCPLRPSVFDVAISIAVIHHYATPERRREAVAALLRLVRADGGKVLIYVWAREANESRPKFQRVLNGETGDALVPWETNSRFDQSRRSFQRYYHLFSKGELEGLCMAAAEQLGARVSLAASYFDQENWCVLLERVAN